MDQPQKASNKYDPNRYQKKHDDYPKQQDDRIQYPKLYNAPYNADKANVNQDACQEPLRNLENSYRVQDNHRSLMAMNFTQDLLKGQVNIKLKDPNQIILWEKILKQLFFVKCSKAKIQMIISSNLFDEGLVIQLQSRDQGEEKLEEMKQSILQSLEEYTQSKFMVRIPDKDLEGVLIQSNLSKTFKRIFQQIHQQFENKILLETIQDRNATQLQCIAYHNKSITDAEIHKALEIHLLQKLDKVVEKIDLKKLVEFLNFEKKNHYEMEESLELLISNSDGQVTFIGLKEQLGTLKNSIQAFDQMQHESLKQHIMCFENDYILKCVFQNLGQLQLLVPPQILNKQLLIKGDRKQISEAIGKINKIIENVKQQMKSQKVQMTELESKYLQKHHQNDLTHIQNTFDCLISEPTLVQGGQQNQQQIQIQQQQPNLNLPQTQQPVTTYQWSWNDGNTFVDYALEINAYIDQGYAKFLKDQTKNTIDMSFPPGKTPGTHQIDLSTMIVTDLTSKSNAQLIQKPDGTYVLAGQLHPDEIANFINQKITQGQIKFDIFLKKYRIIFFDAQIAVQVNIETGFARIIRKSLMQSNPQPANLFQPNRNQAPQPQPLYLNDTHQAFYEIRSQKKESLDHAVIEFKKLLESLYEKKKIRLPNIEDDSKFEKLIVTIKEKSIRIDGEIKPDRLIEITTIKDYMNYIQSLIQVIPNFVFPQEWESQDENLKRIELKQNDQEYMLIKGKFQQTYPAGQITAIFRIQNKHLYKNFVNEQNDLIKRNQDRGTPLTADQKEQLLWHGVRSGHPKLIYNSNKEGFDGTYANQGMWGTGVYFSTRADYSVDFSWTQTLQDGPTHLGHKVFLCCKVATGIAFDCYPDNTLKRPPPLPLPNQHTCYDSVSGITYGTKVYILYQMDIRRAYPAYEVIYK